MPGVFGTTADFVSSNSMIIGGGLPYQSQARVLPPVITTPIVPTVNTMYTTQNYQVLPPVAQTSTAFIQQPVSVIAPPLSSRGLLATGVRPITPPIGVGITTPQMVGPVMTPGFGGSRILNQSQVIVPPGCCPQCQMCAGCGMCGGYGGMGMCGPSCGGINCCSGYGCGNMGCGNMGCGGMGCGCPFD